MTELSLESCLNILFQNRHATIKHSSPLYLFLTSQMFFRDTLDDQHGSCLTLEDLQYWGRGVLTPGCKNKGSTLQTHLRCWGTRGAVGQQMGRTWPEAAGTAGCLTPPLAHTPVTYYVQYNTLAPRLDLTLLKSVNSAYNITRKMIENL